MAEFDLRFTADDELVQWLGRIPKHISTYMRDGLKDAGEVLIKTARNITEQEDAIGATREYYAGFRYDVEFARDDEGRGTMINTSAHAEFVEYGRRAGGFPPKDAVEAWMTAKGIPLEASFVIRRAIAEKGTKGRAIFERTADMARDEVLDVMEQAFNRAVRALQ